MDKFRRFKARIFSAWSNRVAQHRQAGRASQLGSSAEQAVSYPELARVKSRSFKQKVRISCSRNACQPLGKTLCPLPFQPAIGSRVDGAAAFIGGHYDWFTPTLVLTSPLFACPSACLLTYQTHGIQLHFFCSFPPYPYQPHWLDAVTGTKLAKLFSSHAALSDC